MSAVSDRSAKLPQASGLSSRYRVLLVWLAALLVLAAAESLLVYGEIRSGHHGAPPMSFWLVFSMASGPTIDGVLASRRERAESRGSYGLQGFKICNLVLSANAAIFVCIAYAVGALTF